MVIFDDCEQHSSHALVHSNEAHMKHNGQSLMCTWFGFAADWAKCPQMMYYGVKNYQNSKHLLLTNFSIWDVAWKIKLNLEKYIIPLMASHQQILRFYKQPGFNTYYNVQIQIAHNFN